MTIQFIIRLIGLLKAYIASPDPTASGRFYIIAVSCLGSDASPNDIAPDEYGCAETINAIHKKVFGFEIGGGLSTYLLYNVLLTSKYFIKIDSPKAGDIVISPTGYGNGKLSNGHVGIVGKENVIMSNDSATGLFLENYTLDKWRARYVALGGYPMAYFRRI